MGGIAGAEVLPAELCSLVLSILGPDTHLEGKGSSRQKAHGVGRESQKERR
jgi:hypothetical protein